VNEGARNFQEKPTLHVPRRMRGIQLNLEELITSMFSKTESERNPLQDEIPDAHPSEVNSRSSPPQLEGCSFALVERISYSEHNFIPFFSFFLTMNNST
jgi:hypothetical protein